MNIEWAIILLFGMTFLSCQHSNDDNVSPESGVSQTPLDLQGHRGARGLYPENTVLAMEKAIELGVTTLEMDVVITGDSLVILSHEPFMSHEISRSPEGLDISAEQERLHNIFKMRLEEINSYDVGLRPHPRFPGQLKVASAKPLLSQVIEATYQHPAKVDYSIELKRVDGQDDVFHPNPENFTRLVVEVLDRYQLRERTILQCFDIATLEQIHQQAPDIRTAYLISSNPDFKSALDLLSFTPSIYSPDYHLVTPELIAYAHANNMQVIPWTINGLEDMQRLKDMGVDGLISDYPDRYKQLK